jgi:hypothetical protein
MRRITVLALLGSSGCMTVAEGNVAQPIDLGGHFVAPAAAPGTGLVIHGRELPELSSPDFGVLEFTLENPTDRWVRIDQVKVDFAGPAANQGVSVIEGADIVAWETATEQRNAVRTANVQTALDLLALGAAIGAAHHRHAARAPAPVVAGAAVAAVAASLAIAGEAAPRDDLYPDTHLYALPIAIPPGLFAKRWIVFNTDAAANRSCLSRAVLDYTTSAGLRERAVLDFRPFVNGSEWQAPACRSRAPTLAQRRNG